MAFTIVTTSQSVKVIFTFSASGSLTSMPSGFPTTATLYVYDSGTNNLLGSDTLSGTDLTNILYMMMSS